MARCSSSFRKNVLRGKFWINSFLSNIKHQIGAKDYMRKSPHKCSVLFQSSFREYDIVCEANSSLTFKCRLERGWHYGVSSRVE